jgi:hypothetical protein
MKISKYTKQEIKNEILSSKLNPMIKAHKEELDKQAQNFIGETLLPYAKFMKSAPEGFCSKHVPFTLVLGNSLWVNRLS